MPSPTDFKKAFGLGTGSTIAGRFSVTDSHVGHDVVKQNEKYEFPSTISLALPPGASPSEALGALKGQLKEKRMVYSAYGSPYECSWGTPKLKAGGRGGGAGSAGSEEEEEEGGATVVFSCLGKAVRRCELPACCGSAGASAAVLAAAAKSTSSPTPSSDAALELSALSAATGRRDIPTLKEVKEQERQAKGQAQELSAGGRQAGWAAVGPASEAARWCRVWCVQHAPQIAL